MTQSVQTFPAHFGSRKQQQLIAAWEFWLNNHHGYSAAYVRAATQSRGNKKSKRPGFLSLYFAERAKHFPTSTTVRNQRAEQDRLKHEKKTARIKAREEASRARKAQYVGNAGHIPG